MALQRQGAGRKRHRNVRRRDGYGERGWVVQVTRRGRRRVEYFADGVHGGRQEALRRALARRDELEGSLPPAVKLKRKFSRNKTGVVGVCVEVQRLRRGGTLRYYAAGWTEVTGKKVRLRFSVLKHGEREARRSAIKARREAVARILGQRGARVYWQR